MEDGHGRIPDRLLATPAGRFEQTGSSTAISIITDATNSFENPDAVQPTSMLPQLALDAVLEESDSWLAKIDPTLNLLTARFILNRSAPPGVRYAYFSSHFWTGVSVKRMRRAA